MAVEDLWVVSFDSTYLEWTEVGNSPYLHDTDLDRVYETTNNQREGYFGFSNPTGSGADTINSVKFRVETKMTYSGMIGLVMLQVYLHDGTADNALTKVPPNLNAYAWAELDVSAILNTWAKITAAKIYVKMVDEFGACTLYVRRALLRVDYTVAPPPPPPGRAYAMESLIKDSIVNPIEEPLGSAWR